MDKHKRKQVRNIPFRMIIPNMITSGSVFCGVSSLILTSHGKLIPAAALICFAAAPVVGFVTITLRKKFRRMYRKQWRLSDKVNSRLQDVLAGILVVKSYGREKSESEYFCRLTDDLARMQSKNEKFWSTFNPLIGFFFSVGTYLILYVGGLDVLTGRISIGELTQVTMYTSMIIQPLGWIMLFPKQVANLNISMDRIYDILDRQTELSNIDTGIKKDIEGEIEFRNTVFQIIYSAIYA